MEETPTEVTEHVMEITRLLISAYDILLFECGGDKEQAIRTLYECVDFIKEIQVSNLS